MDKLSEQIHLTQTDIDYAQGVLSEVHSFSNEGSYYAADQIRSTAMNLHASHRENAEALLRFSEAFQLHAYWSRLWIVQEVRLARGGAKVIHGPFVLDILFLRLLSDLSRRMAEQSPGELHLSGACFSLVEYSGVKAIANLSSLTDLVLQYGNQLCKDPRDRVYGMLGLVKPSMSAANIEVDHNISRQQLFLIMLYHVLLELDQGQAHITTCFQTLFRNLAKSLKLDRETLHETKIYGNDYDREYWSIFSARKFEVAITSPLQRLCLAEGQGSYLISCGSVEPWIIRSTHFMHTILLRFPKFLLVLGIGCSCVVWLSIWMLAAWIFLACSFTARIVTAWSTTTQYPLI